MELRSVHSPSVSCSIPKSGSLILTPSLNGHFVKLTHFKKYPDARKLSLLNCRAQASVATRSSSVAVEAQDINSKDENLVFVAGATGKVGSRTVRELLKLGCKVRAGVRSIKRAEFLLKSVQQMEPDDGPDKESQSTKKLELVECDLEKPDQIGPAIGNASTVICCIGASEKEISDITGPYRIDYLATKNLVDAATAANVGHFILVTSLGTNKVGFPAAILNLFWGVLIWKRKAEEALLASGIPYTIVRPGGMERPTDSYKETHNLTLSLEDTLFGGQVSNLQVAELLAFMAKNRSLSYCKVVEAIAETTAPLTPMEKLLEKIPPQRIEVKPPKKPSTTDVPQPSVPKSTSSETLSTSLEKQSAEAKETATRPLSPFIAYDDLKPPTSPSPKAPGDGKDVIASTPTVADTDGVKISESVTSIPEHSPGVEETPKERPLSPYAAYEDLKPPCSPCPTPSGPKETPFTVSALAEASEVTKVEAASVVENDPLPVTNYCHSPYSAYEDFKPPTSPSPSSPTITQSSTSFVTGGSLNGTPQPPSSAPQSRPLSPFPMYEDLKPPTSPIPPKAK
ncbi:protein TIC 62, chloroplastic [Heracleum sosnowskyi]|uniref:Protein TIC 62, chloroplastic n=1 Tax=Heracleum sosnowskyi TaxID=360622 RepID=A0AAD8H1J1_9APIA|nr:protein TIC 62, chloroplastic [Heracleum sosnowskyi]